MSSQTNGGTAEQSRITDCREFSSRRPILKLRIARSETQREPRADEAPRRRPKQSVLTVSVALLLVTVITGMFWATYQWCGLLSQRMQELQRQNYRPQTAYSDPWTAGGRW